MYKQNATEGKKKIILEEEIRKSFEATSESGHKRRHILTTEATLLGGMEGPMELAEGKVSQERKQHEPKPRCTKALYEVSSKLYYK